MFEDSGSFLINGHSVAVTLDGSHFEAGRTSIRLEDIAGAGLVGKNQVRVYAYPGDRSKLRKRRANHVTLTSTSTSQADIFVESVQRQINSKKRHLLVLVNPMAGSSKGWRIWTSVLLPLLQEAGLPFTVLRTTRANEGYDFLSGKIPLPGQATTLNLDDYDDIILVGGDGMVYEAIQALHSRPDCESQLHRLNFGVVPAGTGNGLAKTLTAASGEAYSTFNAAFLVVKGRCHAFDLVETTFSSGTKRLGCLNLGWALMADVDLESEAYRWLGALRLTVGALIRICNLRSYPGRISWLPTLASITDIPPIGQPLTNEWITVTGDYIVFSASNTTHIASDMYIDPKSELGDGELQLLIVERTAISKFGLLKLFLVFEDAGHINNPAVQLHRCKAYRLEPLTDRGMYSLDGEHVEYGPIQQSIVPRAANMLCGGQSSDTPAGTNHPTNAV